MPPVLDDAGPRRGLESAPGVVAAKNVANVKCGSASSNSPSASRNSSNTSLSVIDSTNNSGSKCASSCSGASISGKSEAAAGAGCTGECCGVLIHQPHLALPGRGHSKGFGTVELALVGLLKESGKCDGGESAEDHDHHQQFDQGEALIEPIRALTKPLTQGQRFHQEPLLEDSA